MLTNAYGTRMASFKSSKEQNCIKILMLNIHYFIIDARWPLNFSGPILYIAE